MTLTCKTNIYGSKYWYKNDKLYRDGSPAIERADGSNFWYQKGKRHRTDGPAVEFANGDKFWYKNGKLHRTDGPAVTAATGNTGWWIDDNELTPAEFAAKVLDNETAMIWKMSGYCWPFDFGVDK
jgi:hypothetical protein